MVNVWISVEGQTEERFIKVLLDPHFSQRSIFLHPVHMGGNVKLKTVSNEIRKLAYNDGYTTSSGMTRKRSTIRQIQPPSKRLEKYTNYKKTIDGPDIAKEIGLSEIRKKCAGFNAWITMIESWA